MTTEQVCTDCGVLFESEDALVRHRGESGHASVFKCDECAQEFSTHGELETHLADTHAADPDAPIR